MVGCPNCGWDGQPRRAWQIELPFTRPLSLNARMHYMVKAKKTAEIREAAGELIALAGVPPMEHVRTWIAYSPRDERRRDPINLIPTLKACEDAMVDCAVVPDDTPQYVESLMPKILPKNDQKRGFLWLVIEEA
jgi:crossover junction endodeoxyribonuclease RusA